MILISLSMLTSCEEGVAVFKTKRIMSSRICSGEVISGVTGTANCSAGSPVFSSSFENRLYVFSARNDISSVGDWSAPSFLADLASGAVDRSNSVATFESVYEDNDFLDFFKSRYQAVPNPLTDSDGFSNANGVGEIAQRHFLARITGRPDQVCGTTGTIAQRMDHCASINGVKAFYNGKQYGQAGEGDWKLVTRLNTGEEVWRDERTKLIWSDKSASAYNWFQAAGYAKPSAISLAETDENAQPGAAEQPINPISLCAEVDDSGVVLAGGVYSLYDGDYQASSTLSIAFKGNLSIGQNVIWKLPSINEFKLADVNGLRKVLPRVAFRFWSSTSNSTTRFSAWAITTSTGYVHPYPRFNNTDSFVRCVGYTQE